MSDSTLEQLACEIANWWLRERINMEGRMDPNFVRKLNELEVLTRGNERRCFCLSKNSGHDIRCPARKPT